MRRKWNRRDLRKKDNKYRWMIDDILYDYLKK